MALLLDQGDGNDVYQCDIYGQGSSYWYSLGMLVDEGGNDTYTGASTARRGHTPCGHTGRSVGQRHLQHGVGLGQGAAHDWPWAG